jgi:signal transduction histidine kinase
MLGSLVDHCVNGIIVLDKEYRVVVWNRWLEQHSDIKTQDIIDQSLFDQLPELSSGRLKGVIDNALLRGMASFLSQTLSKSPLPLRNPRNHSEKVEQAISVKPLITPQGERYCYIHIDDVTASAKREYHLRELTANAKVAQQTAEEIAELKSSFISTVSHELRTPMTSVLGSLGLLKGLLGDELSDDAKNLTNIAHQNTERLLSLINDILDIEKITSGGIELNYEAFDLMLFFHEAISANAGYATQQKVSFNITEYPHNLVLNADFAKLQQVMNNLLSNAAKHEPEGGAIDISAGQVDDQWIRITVKDHGPGISEEFQNQVFEKFSQADSSNTRGIEGTGLGLAIAKAIIDKHKGNIGFNSAPGEGAEFYIELPLEHIDTA